MNCLLKRSDSGSRIGRPSFMSHLPSPLGKSPSSRWVSSSMKCMYDSALSTSQHKCSPVPSQINAKARDPESVGGNELFPAPNPKPVTCSYFIMTEGFLTISIVTKVGGRQGKQGTSLREATLQREWQDPGRRGKGQVAHELHQQGLRARHPSAYWKPPNVPSGNLPTALHSSFQ